MTDQGPRERRILRLVKPHIVAAAVFSAALNILFLVSPIYMLQVYDRVLTTGSVATLLLLSGIAVFLLVVYLFAEAGRRRVLGRAAQLMSDELAEPALKQGFGDSRATPNETVAVMGSLQTLQQAFSQALPGVVFDLPFVPFFLLILFVVHPALGMVGLVGAAGLILLAVLTEKLTKEPLAEAQKAERGAQNELTQLVRQRGAIAGMGMGERAIARWSELRKAGVNENLHAGTPATFLGAATRALRMILQIAILGGGAFLAVRGQVSAGAIIASSIIMGRALAPIDQMVNAWRQLAGAYSAYKEVDDWLVAHHEEERTILTPMPRPEPQITLDELQVTVPGADKPLLATIEKVFPKGQIVALLGQSGSGKTSFLQTVAGAWPPLAGTARLGQRDLWQWDPADRGQHVGYLPQNVELLRGTVRENIARFTQAPAEKVFEAARKVGCHELILSLPNAYDTMIGEGGHYLSAGQRQSIGLARALFGNPPLLILDEPTAHLDSDLTQNIMSFFANASRLPAEERGFTAIVATHDLRLLNAADDVMIIKDRGVIITPREAYLNKISQLRRSQQQQAVKARPTSSEGGTPLTVDLTRRSDDNG
jgi:PrtD family type I secretion system ABC transporter